MAGLDDTQDLGALLSRLAEYSKSQHAAGSSPQTSIHGSNLKSANGGTLSNAGAAKDTTTTAVGQPNEEQLEQAILKELGLASPLPDHTAEVDAPAASCNLVKSTAQHALHLSSCEAMNSSSIYAASAVSSAGLSNSTTNQNPLFPSVHSHGHAGFTSQAEFNMMPQTLFRGPLHDSLASQSIMTQIPPGVSYPTQNVGPVMTQIPPGTSYPTMSVSSGVLAQYFAPIPEPQPSTRSDDDWMTKQEEFVMKCASAMMHDKSAALQRSVSPTSLSKSDTIKKPMGGRQYRKRPSPGPEMHVDQQKRSSSKDGDSGRTRKRRYSDERRESSRKRSRSRSGSPRWRSRSRESRSPARKHRSPRRSRSAERERHMDRKRYSDDDSAQVCNDRRRGTESADQTDRRKKSPYDNEPLPGLRHERTNLNSDHSDRYWSGSVDDVELNGKRGERYSTDRKKSGPDEARLNVFDGDAPKDGKGSETKVGDKDAERFLHRGFDGDLTKAGRHDHDDGRYRDRRRREPEGDNIDDSPQRDGRNKELGRDSNRRSADPNFDKHAVEKRYKDTEAEDDRWDRERKQHRERTSEREKELRNQLEYLRDSMAEKSEELRKRLDSEKAELRGDLEKKYKARQELDEKKLAEIKEECLKDLDLERGKVEQLNREKIVLQQREKLIEIREDLQEKLSRSESILGPLEQKNKLLLTELEKLKNVCKELGETNPDFDEADDNPLMKENLLLQRAISHKLDGIKKEKDENSRETTILRYKIERINIGLKSSRAQLGMDEEDLLHQTANTDSSDVLTSDLYLSRCISRAMNNTWNLPSGAHRTPRYRYTDKGGHFCSSCKVRRATIIEFLRHLHSQSHWMKAVDPTEKPWIMFKNVDDEGEDDSHLPEKPYQGLEFLVPTFAFFCNLCKVPVFDKASARVHVKSEAHNTAYEMYVLEHPSYGDRYDESGGDADGKDTKQRKTSKLSPKKSESEKKDEKPDIPTKKITIEVKTRRLPLESSSVTHALATGSSSSSSAESDDDGDNRPVATLPGIERPPAAAFATAPVDASSSVDVLQNVPLPPPLTTPMNIHLGSASSVLSTSASPNVLDLNEPGSSKALLLSRSLIRALDGRANIDDQRLLQQEGIGVDSSRSQPPSQPSMSSSLDLGIGNSGEAPSSTIPGLPHPTMGVQYPFTTPPPLPYNFPSQLPPAWISPYQTHGYP